jgi:hypothetical protein
MMEREWVKEVLVDLEAFTSDNNLPQLSDKIREARIMAQVEIATKPRQTRSEIDNVVVFGAKFRS